MNLSLIFTLSILIAIVLWLVGLAIYGYHVFAYGLPKDATIKSLYALVLISALALLVSVYYVSGFNWGAL
jgi:hypothetical protein